MFAFLEIVKNAARLAVYVATNIVPVIHQTAATTLPTIYKWLVMENLHWIALLVLYCFSSRPVFHLANLFARTEKKAT